MKFIPRLIAKPIKDALRRGKSILLLGPRQTGKTTLIESEIKPDLTYTLVSASTRQRYEKNPVLFESELLAEIERFPKPPIIYIDEVQKIPRIMDTVQQIIDKKLAQFILTGSSARKLKHGAEINLLPGRVVSFTMPPFVPEEIRSLDLKLNDFLIYGSLPGIILERDKKSREIDLYSYVTTYLEDEIRSEAAVRNVGSFARFLEIAAAEAGKQINFTRISQDVGVADTTIANYFQILEDCLIATRIDPIFKSASKRKLTKSAKYLFFDLGVRRLAARESVSMPTKILGEWFEHFVGNLLVNYSHLTLNRWQVKYWKDLAGPEIDFVLTSGDELIPIEVKYTDKPNLDDARHLKKFLEEYSAAQHAYVICRVPKRLKLSGNITALPWQDIHTLFE